LLKSLLENAPVPISAGRRFSKAAIGLSGDWLIGLLGYWPLARNLRSLKRPDRSRFRAIKPRDDLPAGLDADPPLAAEIKVGTTYGNVKADYWEKTHDPDCR
jgi:hypothetical protein